MALALAVTALVAIGIVAGLLFAHRRGHLLAAAHRASPPRRF
jgi:hypothetical protein